MSKLDESPYSPQISTQDKSWVLTIRRLCADGTALYQVTRHPKDEEFKPFRRVKHNPETNDFSILDGYDTMPDEQPGDEMLMVMETLEDNTLRITY